MYPKAVTTDVWSSLLSCFLQPLNYHIINQLKSKVTSDDKCTIICRLSLGYFTLTLLMNSFVTASFKSRIFSPLIMTFSNVTFLTMPSRLNP